MNRISRLKSLQNQAKLDNQKSSQFADKLSLGLLIVGPILGGIPWIFSYFAFGKRLDAPKAMKYAKWSGKLVLLCYLTLIVGYFFGKGEKYLQWLDTFDEETIKESP